MKVTVYGAGAIGGTTGAALARAGHDVLLGGGRSGGSALSRGSAPSTKTGWRSRTHLCQVFVSDFAHTLSDLYHAEV